jgi:integrase
VKKSTYGFGSLRQDGDVWYVRYRVNGVQREESAQTTDKAKAEAFLKQRLGEVATGEIDAAPQAVTIADLCALVAADYRLRKLRSVKDVDWRFDRHIKPALGSVKASRFGPNQIRQYVAKRRTEGAEDSTINRELSIVRRGFSLARRKQPPLVHTVPYIPMLEEDNVRQGFIEEPEYRLLLSILPDDLKAAFVLAYHCGNRLGEIRKIEPGQLNLEAGEIRIRQSQAKGKRDRVIPVYGDMYEWLEWQLKRLPAGCPYLFFRGKGKRIGSHMKGWPEACTEAGLDGLLFHDLRRSAVRNMDRAGIRREVGMAISGHRTPDVYRRYGIVADEEFREVGEKMAAFRAKQKPKLQRVK